MLIINYSIIKFTNHENFSAGRYDVVYFELYVTKSNPPSAVESAFSKAFPGITPKNWDKEDNKYEANFAKDGKTMSATFDANGNLEETETDIAVRELPSAIASYIQTHYKGERIKEATMITKPNGEKMYEAEVKGKDLLFDMQGKFLKEEKEAKGDKEDKINDKEV